MLHANTQKVKVEGEFEILAGIPPARNCSAISLTGI
jgi:hypothetical protein